MITTLPTLWRDSPGMIRGMNKHSNEILTIGAYNIRNIKRMPSKHPFWKNLFVAI